MAAEGIEFANKLILGYTTVSDDRGFAGDPFPDVLVEDGDGDIFLGSEPLSSRFEPSTPRES